MQLSRNRFLQLASADNTAICLEDVPAGIRVPHTDVTLTEAIRAGHKVALKPIKTGQSVYKYGQVIGVASHTIQPGNHVHTHNLVVDTLARQYDIGSDAVSTDDVPKVQYATFEGFKRANGRCGTRNFIGILPTVACASSLTRFIAATIDSK